MLNFVLCEDNINILSKLSKILESIFIKHDIDADVVFKTDTAEDIISYVNSNKVDVLILDINLKSNMTGINVADEIRKNNKKIYIIFYTGHLEYALLAYKYKTFDYLPKPVIEEKLEETVLRLVDDMKSTPSKFLRLNNNKVIIKQEDINYIKKDGMKLVVCTNSNNYESYTSFSKIEDCLPDNFIRCHKSFICNINNIVDINSSKNVIMFNNKMYCNIGDKYKTNFMEVFKNGNFTNNLDSTYKRK